MADNRIMFWRVSSILLAALALSLQSSPLAAESAELIYAFRNYQRPEPIRMLLVGEIQSKIKASQTSEKSSPFSGYDTRLDQVTVKVRNPAGLKVGQKLYIIDKNPHHQKYRNGLIVGEISVQSVLKTSFYGWVVTGTGILLRVREGLFVARMQESESLAHALDLKKKGDYYSQRGEIKEAIATYQSALVADPELPDAHAALGSIFLAESRKTGEFPSRAMSEFDQAWKYKENFHYGYDEMQFYRDYQEALYAGYRIRRLDSAKDQSTHLINRLLQTCDAADRLIPEDPDTLLNRLRYHLAIASVNQEATSKENRKKYDESMKLANVMLEKLHPIVRNPETYLRRLKAFRDGEHTATLLTAGEAEYHRLAVSYYGRSFADIKNSPIIEDSARREKYIQQIKTHAKQFQLHSSRRDPELEQILSQAR